jgi:hypothetical protein
MVLIPSPSHLTEANCTPNRAVTKQLNIGPNSHGNGR